MKKLFLLLPFLASIAVQAQSANFKGTIKNPTVDSLVINGLSIPSRLRIPVDKNGNFEVTATFESRSYELQYGFSKLYIYLNEKTNLTLTADGSDFPRSLTFDGQGAVENNFLQVINKERLALELQLSENAGGDFKKLKKAAEKIMDSWAGRFSKKYSLKGENAPMFVALAMQDQRVKESLQRLQFLNALAGTPVPGFTFKDVKGNAVSLADFRGKYVVIDVWATWCVPCIAEHPFLKVIEEDFKTENVVFIGLSLDTSPKEQKWKQFVEDKGLHGVQLIVHDKQNNEFFKTCGVDFIPRFIIIAPNGTFIDAYAHKPSDGLYDQLKALFKNGAK